MRSQMENVYTTMLIADENALSNFNGHEGKVCARCESNFKKRVMNQSPAVTQTIHAN